MEKTRRFESCAILAACALLTACGNTLNCELEGDNVQGHIIYGEGITRTAGRRLHIQVSTNGFASDVSTAERIFNSQGLVAIPYSYCAESDQDLTFRAFEDTNDNHVWDAGEPAGRNDGTTNGNGTYTVHNFPEPNPSAVPPVDWEIAEGVNITLDATAAQ